MVAERWLFDVAAARVYVAGVVALRYVLLPVALRVDVAELRDMALDEVLRYDAIELALDRDGVVYRVDAYAVPPLRRFTGPVTTVRLG